MTKIYLVGDKRATKVNSWLAMTNDRAEAERLREELPTATTIKEVTVRPSRKGGKK